MKNRKRLLITGGGGFMGKEIANQFIQNGYDVISLDRTKKKLGCDSLPNVLENQNKLTDLVLEFEPTLIIHAASNSSVIGSWDSPLDFVRQNSQLTANLIHSIRELESPPKFVFISSSQVYVDQTQPISESSAVGPNTPYGISKYLSELIVQECKEHLIIRPFFIIGAGKTGDVFEDWAAQVAAIESDASSEPVLRTGNLSTTRDFLDVESAAKLIFQLSECIRATGIVNLGSGTSTSLNDVAAAFVMASKINLEIQNTKPQRRSDREVVVADVKLLHSLVGNYPGKSLDLIVDEYLNSERLKIKNDSN